MANVTHNNTNTDVLTTNASSVSVSMSVTAGNPNLAAVCRIVRATGSSIAGSVSSCSYNSVAMTAAGAEEASAIGVGGGCKMLVLPAPSTGANTLAITTGETEASIYCDLSAYFNANQSSVVRPGSYTVGDSGASSTASESITVPSAVGDMTTSVATCLTNTSAIIATNQTLRNNDTGGTTSFGSDDAAGAATVTHTWTVNPGAAGSIAVGFSIQAAGAAVVTRPAAITQVRNPDAVSFNGGVLLLKRAIPSNPPIAPRGTHLYLFKNLDSDPFGGGVLQLKSPVVTAPIASVKQASTFLFLNRGDDTYLTNVVYVHPPTLTSLQVPSTFLFLNRGDDTYAGSVQYFKAPVVQPVAPPSLPVPATFLFLSRGDDSFPGEILSMRSIIIPVTPPSSILQRRTLHAFGTHAGGRTSRGDN